MSVATFIAGHRVLEVGFGGDLIARMAPVITDGDSRRILRRRGQQVSRMAGMFVCGAFEFSSPGECGCGREIWGVPRTPEGGARVARIPLVDLNDPNLDPELRDRLSASPLIQGLGLSPGGAPNVIRAMANHPDMLQAGFMAGYHPSSAITPLHRELAYLTASVLNNCHY